MVDLSTSDPVAEVIHHLSHDPAVEAALRGPGRVSSQLEDPFPRVVVTIGSTGQLVDLRSTIGHEVTLQLYGPADNSIGPAELWRILMVVLTSVTRMSEREHVPGRPVVHNSRVQGGTPDQPLSTGQRRYTATVFIKLGLVQGELAP